MALLDIFTGNSAKNAATTNTGLYTGAKNQIYNLADITKSATTDYLKSGYGDAKTDLGTGYNASTGAINTAAGSALGYLDTGTSDALGRLDSAKSTISSAYQPLTDLATKYGTGSTLYANALGINGAEGTTAAQNAFSASPTYNWTMDQGIEAINRRRNAAGSLNGGNADRDATNYAAGLASTEYNNWLDRLKDYNNLELSATSGAASGNASAANYDATAANLLNTSGVNKANVASSQGTSLADLAKSYYSDLSNLDTAEGTALANNMTGNTQWLINAENNAAGNIANQNTTAANAETTGSANLWNLGLNAAKLATGTAGSSSLGSSLGSLFGGTTNTTGYTTNPWSSQGTLSLKY